MAAIVERHAVGESRMAREFGDFQNIVQKLDRIIDSRSETLHFRCLFSFIEMVSELIGADA